MAGTKEDPILIPDDDAEQNAVPLANPDLIIAVRVLLAALAALAPAPLGSYTRPIVIPDDE
jgi:hypothetical protein